MGRTSLVLFLTLGLSLLTVSHDAFAQSEGCSACGVLGGCIFFPIAISVISIIILVWVARDAKARGMDNAVLWMLVVFFLNFVGLIIYLLSRPTGQLTVCTNCSNKRLQSSMTCPHCGRE